MRYATGQLMKIGDEVRVDGMRGVVVCDFDNREFAKGYIEWDQPHAEISDGYRLDSGVMIMTVQAGLVHYANESAGSIEPLF